MTKRAVTLVELLIAVAVLGIVAAAVVTSMSPETAEHLRGAGEVMAADLAYVRSLAVANNSSYRVTFDLAANQYYLEHSGANSALNVLPAGPFGRADDLPTRRTARLDELADCGGRVRIDTVMAGSGTVTLVEFGPLGQTTQSNTTTIWLAAGSSGEVRFLPLSIHPVTGLTCVGKVQSALPGAGAFEIGGGGGAGGGGGVGL